MFASVSQLFWNLIVGLLVLFVVLLSTQIYIAKKNHQNVNFKKRLSDCINALPFAAATYVVINMLIYVPLYLGLWSSSSN